MNRRHLVFEPKHFAISMYHETYRAYYRASFYVSPDACQSQIHTLIPMQRQQTRHFESGNQLLARNIYIHIMIISELELFSDFLFLVFILGFRELRYIYWERWHAQCELLYADKIGGKYKFSNNLPHGNWAVNAVIGHCGGGQSDADGANRFG